MQFSKVDELNDSIKMLKAKLEEAQEARANLITARASLQQVLYGSPSDLLFSIFLLSGYTCEGE